MMARCSILVVILAFLIVSVPVGSIGVMGKTVGELFDGLVPGADDYREIGSEATGGFPEGVKRAFLAYSKGKTHGLIVKVETLGYSATVPISALVGLDNRGTVTSVRVLNHDESPGWADNLDKGTLQARFLYLPIGRALVLVQQLKAVLVGEVEAVTGATITSKGLARGVAAARALFRRVMVPLDR